MIKKISIILFIIFASYCFYSPIVITLNKNIETYRDFKFVKNDILNLKKIILKKGKKYKAYIVLNREELEYLSPKINNCRVLTCDDKVLMDELLSCEFKYSGGDASTIQSKIFIYSDNSLIFESEISLDANLQGLQNRQFGWIEPIQADKFIDICSKFNRYKWPILIIW
jgi:hypothetical protein